MLKPFIELFEVQDAAHARWLSMEGLRGFAVGLVFLVHYSSLFRQDVLNDQTSYWWLAALHEVGNTGVDLFFVLSGFLIYRTCIDRPIRIGRYAYRRLERIYPTFLAALILYIGVMMVYPTVSKFPTSLEASSIYLVENILLLPGMFHIKPIITVAWSLSYEAFFYVAMPVVIALLSMRKWLPHHRIALFVVLYLAMVVADLETEPVHFRLSMFIGGIILYEISTCMPQRDHWIPGSVIDLSGIALLGLALASFTLLGNSRWALSGTLFASIPSMAKFVILNLALVFVVYRCLFVDGLAAGLFSWSPLRRFGNMSYSYYLFHGFGLHLFFLALAELHLVPAADPIFYPFLLLPAFAFSVLFSMLPFLLVERPLSLR